MIHDHDRCEKAGDIDEKAAWLLRKDEACWHEQCYGILMLCTLTLYSVSILAVFLQPCIVIMFSQSYSINSPLYWTSVLSEDGSTIDCTQLSAALCWCVNKLTELGSFMISSRIHIKW